VHMRRFISITRIEEKPVWAFSQYCRHLAAHVLFCSPDSSQTSESYPKTDESVNNTRL
jgi:hypothetical protein